MSANEPGQGHEMPADYRAVEAILALLQFVSIIVFSGGSASPEALVLSAISATTSRAARGLRLNSASGAGATGQYISTQERKSSI